MKMRLELTEEMVRQLIMAHLAEKLGDVRIKPENVNIEVKSKQNYKSEWEVAAFRVVFEGNV
jgi:hypothetical protein